MHPDNGPAGNYRALAQGGLKWVSANIDLFALPSLDDPALIDALKPFGELALTLSVVCERTAGRERGAARELLNWAWEQTERGTILERVVHEHHELVSLCWLYEIFHRFDYEHPPFKRLVEVLVRMRAIRQLEMLPWRELELATSLIDLGIPTPWSRDASIRRTWLAALPEPWVMNIAFGYSATHTVFYATRFGRRPSDLPRAMREHLRKWYPVWTRVFMHEGNLDLVAELVMSARCAGLPDDERYDRLLISSQESDGLVPGPVRPGSAVPAELSRRQRFDGNYHTTLVGLMAGVMDTPYVGVP